MPDASKPTLLIIDGHSLAFRAFYALPLDSFSATIGGVKQHTNAIHGFLSMLLTLLKNENPTHLGVAFDISRYSFRTREYPEYKGTRADTPEEFKGQVPLLEEALHAMNIRTLTKEDYEADDILATLSQQGVEQGFEVKVVSGDRDTIQLIQPGVTLLYPNVQGVSELKRYDREAVLEKYGVEPEQYPELAALVGESSDNLIGIDKVGPKTAAKWIQQWGTVENIIAHADEIKGVVGENLRAQKENALRNRRLNRLLRDVELPYGPADLERMPIDTAAVREVFGKLQFRTLLDRVLKLAGAEATDGAVETAPVPEPETAIPPVRQLVDEELAHWLKRTAGVPVGVVVDHDREGIAGIGLATLEESVYVPYKAGTGDYVALAEWLASDAPKQFFNAKPQLEALARAGMPTRGVAYDTRVAGALVAPQAVPASIADQIYYVLGESLPQSDPNQLLPETEPVGSATVAWYVVRLAEAIDPGLSEGTKRVYETIELPLIPVLVDMELAGVAVDAAILGNLRESLTRQAEEHQALAFAAIGHEVNLGSPKQLQDVLFAELGMPKTRATKTGYSTDAAALADLQETNPHPFLEHLLAHRDATKLKQMIETLEKSIGADGRIHTTYDQVGAATGRISSNDPNLQNIPARTEAGKEIRSAFVAGEGYECLLTADYSQIELRLMAHLSGDQALIDAFNEGEDLHRYVGAHVFGVAPEDVTPEMRVKVKAMSYGLAYGLSAFGLSKQLRISQAEARQLMDDYFTRFGKVREYLREVVAKAKVDGYTETLFGRRRPFPDFNSPNKVLRDNAERAALNSPLQGTAADIMKIAMLGVARDLRERGLGSRLLLQVHDELVVEVAPGEWDEVAALVEHRMSTAAELRVPLTVQIGRGANWDAAAH